MTDISPELVERMAAVLRAYAGCKSMEFAARTGRSLYAEACSIVDQLPEPVDPDLIEAREMVIATHAERAAESPWRAGQIEQIKSGKADALFRVADTLAGIKRGRELARTPTPGEA